GLGDLQRTIEQLTENRFRPLVSGRNKADDRGESFDGANLPRRLADDESGSFSLGWAEFIERRLENDNSAFRTRKCLGQFDGAGHFERHWSRSNRLAWVGSSISCFPGFFALGQSGVSAEAGRVVASARLPGLDSKGTGDQEDKTCYPERCQRPIG